MRARQAFDQCYRELLGDTEGLDLLAIPEGVAPNFSYFPVLVRVSFAQTRDGLYDRLKEHGILSRRYFYPLLSSLPM